MLKRLNFTLIVINLLFSRSESNKTEHNFVNSYFAKNELHQVL